MTVNTGCMYSLEIDGDGKVQEEDRTSMRPYTELRGGGHGSLRGVLMVLSYRGGAVEVGEDVASAQAQCNDVAYS
jgi:hypothetical protein